MYGAYKTEIEILTIEQPPRQVTHARGGNGYVNPRFNDTSLWSASITPPVVPDAVELDWLSTRPRIFLWRGFVSRTNAVDVRRLVLNPQMDQYREWNQGRDLWRVPIGVVPILDAWTHRVQAMWPEIPYVRDFITVTRYPPGPLKVQEHYDNHVTSAVLYLSNGGDAGGFGIDEGGWTSFPKSGWAGRERATSREVLHEVDLPEQPRCAEGLQVAPQIGTLLGFYNFYPNSSMDLSAVHASCPTLRSDKWIVSWFFQPTTKPLHLKSFFGRYALHDPV